MPIRLDSRADDFAAQFAVFLAAKRESAADVEEAVRTIIAQVAERGDEALVAYARKFDRADVEASSLRVTLAEIADAFDSCDRQARDALVLARDRIEAYHRRQMPINQRFVDE